VTAQGPVATKTPEAIPTVTETQTLPPPDTMSPQVGQIDKPDDDDVFFDPPAVSPAEAVGYSILFLLAVCGLILLGLWMGYIMGWKDKESREMKFLDTLRDQFYYKGEHR